MARATKPSPQSEDGAERVQKILARAGLASRREAEEWIRAGRVTINGETATLGSKAQGSDQLRLDGRLVHKAPANRAATWICHRSPGENLMTPDAGEEAAPDGRNAVSERLSRRVGRRYIAVSPMPRIDGGMELLTSDGELATRLQRAIRAMPIEFSMRVRGEIMPDQLEGLLEGELDNGERMQITECEATGGESSNRWYKVMTIGANGRDLRSLVERQGVTVSRVLRVAMGGLHLERTLGRGKVRQLQEDEIESLLQVDAPATDSPEPAP
jgi:23S rRNA pseudouridine2605 synthase